MVGKMSRTRRNLIALATAVAAGCSAVVPADLALPGGSASPEGASAAARLVAGAMDVERVVLVAPPVERWPRAMRGAGPFYLLVQASPYVGHFGVTAEGNRADAGTGFGAVVGRRTVRGMSRMTGFEAFFESSGHYNPHSGVDGTATRAGIGLAVSFRPDEKLQPFVLAGAGYYMLRFEELDPKFDITGPGGYLGGGLDIVAARRFTVRAELRVHVWSAADGSGSGGVAGTTTFALGVATAF